MASLRSSPLPSLSSPAVSRQLCSPLRWGLPTAVLVALAGLAFTAGCASEGGDDGVASRSPSGTDQGTDAAAGSAGASANAGAGGSVDAGSGGTAGASGAAAAPEPTDDLEGGSDDTPALPAPAPPTDGEGSGKDAGYCSPTLVILMPTSTMAATGKGGQANVRIHADTTGDDFGAAKNRYTAPCGESGGTDVLIGLDAAETGALTLALSGSSPGFSGVLSVERGTCSGSASALAAETCAVANENGTATLTLDVKAGEHLFVFIDTKSAHGGEFDLTATMAPTPAK
jgi:hypothetical protein